MSSEDHTELSHPSESDKAVDDLRMSGALASSGTAGGASAALFPVSSPRVAAVLFETVLSRVLRRSSEFSVGTIKLSPVEQIACLVIVATSFGWFCLFIQQQLGLEALPWCAVLMFTAIFSLARYLSKRQVNIFELLNLAGQSPLTFAQSFAFSYLSFSAVIWLSLWLFHGVQLKDTHIPTRQVVDIELVSDKDFSDKKDILPGSIEKPSLKSHKNDVEFTQRSPVPLTKQPPAANSRSTLNSTAGSVAPGKSQQKPNVSTEPTASPRRQLAEQPTERYIINVAEAPKIAHGVPAPATTPGDVKSRSRQTVLEEVAPPEMVEITENQGDNGNDTYQPGGRSSGGTGKKTQLVSYLKELHRRIKHAWTPPAGEERSAEILFRIRKNGTLASIKLVTSSGDSDADGSAMRAIAACSPFKSLPTDYPAAYLDLQYTFNYSVDELSEVGGEAH
jgi:TonB family protein